MTTSGPGRDAILLAALELFARHGADAVSVRDIAAAAGVAPSLIPHHYGSKAGLRAAVDDHVSTIFDGVRSDALVEIARGDLTGASAGSFAALLLRHLPPGSPIPAYLRRLLLAGDPAGHHFYRQWHELSLAALEAMEAAGLTRASADREARAAFLMVNDLAMILLHDHIARTLGIDPLSPEGLHRWSAEALDAYTHGIFNEEKA